MRFSQLVALGASIAAALAAPFPEHDSVAYERFEDVEHGTTMRFVKNSGICETTPGVNQYSGYLTVGPDMHMWFWFFEARNSPETAPLATWFNGGPGCSSMIGLFQENGPCQFYQGSSEPQRNPNSYNEFANMLYIDQPIGVGFSYGTDKVSSTDEAAPYVWKLLQAFFKQFPQYESRDFGIFTESYGGHYGSEFAYYIEQQNKGISDGSVQGENINLVALGINNGYYDALIQQPAYIEYAYQNKYKKIIDKSEYDRYMSTFNSRCKPAQEKCTSADDVSQNQACSNAENVCYQLIEGAITREANFDVYDVRQGSNDPFPPSTYVNYLNRRDIQQKIGAQPRTYQECSSSAGGMFNPTGDQARPFLDKLSSVVQSGIQVLIFAGDADYICNYIGNFDVVNSITYPQQAAFKGLELKNYTVAGESKGLFKTLGNLSWLQVYEAGHEVPYYQPEVSLQAFKQTLSKKPLTST